MRAFASAPADSHLTRIHLLTYGNRCAAVVDWKPRLIPANKRTGLDMPQTSRPTAFADKIRLAKRANVIDKWSRHGEHMIFTCGAARFYVHREEAKAFVEGLLRDRMEADVAALERGDYGNFMKGFRQQCESRLICN